MRGAAKQSKWKRAGFLVRNVTTTRDVATTGFEVLDGKGLPIKIVDQKTGEELNELLPLTGSLNLVRRTAAAQFGYTKQVIVEVAPKPPAGKRKRHLGHPTERLRMKRLVEWEDCWSEWVDGCGSRRDEEVDFRVLKAASTARSEKYGEDGRRTALEDLEMLASTSANLRGFDENACRALSECLQGPLDEASAKVVWRLASHSDRRMASLLWGQRLVHEVCRAKGVEHASALACCLESHTSRSQDFDPVPCLLQLIAKEATARIAANALCGWLSNVPAARAAFADQHRLQSLEPFLKSPLTELAAAICQAASCVLRDEKASILPADAASLIRPLADLCDRLLKAVATRSDAVQLLDDEAAVASTRARLALAQRSQGLSDSPRLLAHATVALWSAARAAADGDPTEWGPVLHSGNADKVLHVCLAVAARAAAHLVDDEAEPDACAPAPASEDCACAPAPAPAPVEAIPPGEAAAGVSAAGAALGTLAVLGPWCFKCKCKVFENEVPALCLALVEAARPRGSAACAVTRPVDDDERISLVGGPAWHVMETAAACLSEFGRSEASEFGCSAPSAELNWAREEHNTCIRALASIRTAEDRILYAGDDAEAAAALRRTAQHLACFVARCAARDDYDGRANSPDPHDNNILHTEGWRKCDVEAAVALCTSERSGKVRGHGCRALWALLRRKEHRRAAARAGAAHLLLDCIRCPDVDDAVALAALALLARTEGRAILEAGGLERLADEAARAFARERTADAGDMARFIHIRALAVAALYALVRGREVEESRLDSLDERPMPIVALLAKDAASLEERGPGLSLRAGSVLLGVALCDQSLRQRAALQRCTEAGFLESVLGALVVACASFLPDNEAWSSGHLAASVRAVVLLTTAPASRKRLGVDRSLVRALASIARHGDGADDDADEDTPRSASLASLPHKIRMITEDAFRALLNLSAEETARPALCEAAIPLLLKVAAYVGDELGDFARAILANLMCDGASRAALYHYQLAAASKGVIEQRNTIKRRRPPKEIKSRADLYPVAPPLVPPAVNTLLRGSALNLWQADGTELKKLNATHRSTLLLGGADGSRWKPPVSRFCGVGDTPAEEEPAEEPAPAPAPAPEPAPETKKKAPEEAPEATPEARKSPSKAGILAKLLTRPDDDEVREKLARGHQTVEAGPSSPPQPKAGPDASWVVLASTDTSEKEFFHFASDGRRRTLDRAPPKLVKWKRVEGARVSEGLFDSVGRLDGEGCYFYHAPQVACVASAPDALLQLPHPHLKVAMDGPLLARAPPQDLPPIIFAKRAPRPSPMDSMIPVLPLTLITSQLGDACEEDEEDDWRVEQSLYAQRQFQTDFNTFDDSDEVARSVLAADWDSIKTNTALIELLEKCEEAGAKHDEKKHKSRMKLAKQRAAAVEEYKLELEKQRVAISGLEDIEVEGEVLTKLPDELQKEVDVGETPSGPSGLDTVLESVHDALKKDFRAIARVFDHYCACQNFLKIRSKRASRGSMDTLQSSAMDTLDSSLQSLDSPTVASLESTVMSPLNSPSASVVGFFSAPESANYVDPSNLFGLHEPHFRVFLREIGLKLPGRKARKTFERAAEGPSLTRATFLHALVRLALRASKKRPHQAIAKLVGRVAKTPAAADDNHRAKLFYGRDTERAFGAHVKELQRLFVVYAASDDDATRVIAHVNGRLPLQKWLDLMSDGDVLQTTYLELTPQVLHLAFFRARPLSLVPEQALAFVDFLEALSPVWKLSRVAAACAELPGACDFSHPLSIEDALEIRRAEMRREAAEQARAAILAEQEKAKPKKGKKAGSSVKTALGVDLAALREAPAVAVEDEEPVPVSEAALRKVHAAKLDWLLRHLIARVALKKGGVLGGGKELALVPKYLSKAQLSDPRSTRTSLDFPLWCAEQDVAAQDPDADGAVEETEDM